MSRKRKRKDDSQRVDVNVRTRYGDTGQAEGIARKNKAGRRVRHKGDKIKRKVAAEMERLVSDITDENGGGLDTWEEKDFYIPTTNAKGRGDRVHIGILPSMKSLCDSIVALRIFPYQSIGQIIRHALYRHFFYLETLDKDIPTTFKQVTTVVELSRDTLMRVQLLDMFAEIKVTIDEMHDEGMRDALNDYLEKARGHLEAIPEVKWRKIYLTKFDADFGKWLKVRSIRAGRRIKEAG